MPNPQPGNGLNKTSANPSKPHSNYKLVFDNGITPRFGVNTPFFSLNVVPDDGPVHIQPNCSTRSYTLKAPSFGKISKHIAFYQVPLQCLLPINWEKIVKNSQYGTDVQGSGSGTNLVPALDGVNTVISNPVGRLVIAFNTDFSSLMTNLRAFLTASNYNAYVLHILQFIVRWEMFFSHGNLLSHLGVHYGSVLTFTTTTNTYTFDGFTDYLLRSLQNISFRVTDSEGTSFIRASKGFKHIRRVLDFMRSYSGPFSVSSASAAPVPSSLPEVALSWNLPAGKESEPLNYGMCAAYQIVNAHYYTNDRIDYIYTADLYRQYIGSLLNSESDGEGAVNYPQNFSFNGISVQYDYLSGFYMNRMFEYLSLGYTDSDFWQFGMPYFNAIFGFNYSLRYLDYFAGARPRNLAISGPNTPTNVQVVDNSVQVVNITKGLVAQRFLNAVARVEGNIEDYSEKILGSKLSFDWHNPKYLFSYDMDLFTQEIENTAEAQITDPNSVTSVYRGSANNLEFTLSVDRHSWIIGIETFDIKRFYFSTQDKNTMAVDRFDMFVPELQYIGDQELKRSELIAGSEKDTPFGYQLRDMQFKQTFPQCCGGFVENLPGWLYKFNVDEFYLSDIDNLHISPDFIRSKPTEIDEFYVSLTGMTLASYFHFIEVWSIGVNINRPMIAAPEIL